MTEQETAKLHHEIEGLEDAPVLVLANSLGTTLGMWDDQAPTFSERFKLVRFDNRGHGKSSVPEAPYAIEDLGRDALAMLDELGIERFSFCGLSIGGMTGMWLASEVPERVERLVLCCTSALLGPRETWDERISVSMSDGVGALEDGALDRWFTPQFRASRPETMERIGKDLRETPAEGYAGCCAAIRDMDLRDRLGSIQAPTLIISGSDDPATPPDHGKFVHGGISGSEFVVVEPAAHLANIEQPEKVNRAILDHLAPVLS
ncbi:3-oxoadipate enol-lactonase [soil metagenome]